MKDEKLALESAIIEIAEAETGEVYKAIERRIKQKKWQIQKKIEEEVKELNALENELLDFIRPFDDKVTFATIGLEKAMLKKEGAPASIYFSESWSYGKLYIRPHAFCEDCNRFYNDEARFIDGCPHCEDEK